MKSFDWNLQDIDRWNEKQKEKEERLDKGFTDYHQVAAKKYNKLTKELKPNLQSYQAQKQSMEESLSTSLVENQEYKAAFTSISSKPSTNAVEKMSQDLDQQLEKRMKFSKRRKHNEEDSVTYINDRNMRFNKKISRAYDKYTADIKAAFERGTALD